jgi:hypothetical protein
VLTSAGAVAVTAPRVNDKRTNPDTGERQRFSSAILPPWVGKTPKITEVLPLLYLHGLSSGDFVPALGQFLGSSKGLSASNTRTLSRTFVRQVVTGSRAGWIMRLFGDRCDVLDDRQGADTDWSVWFTWCRRC